MNNQFRSFVNVEAPVLQPFGSNKKPKATKRTLGERDKQMLYSNSKGGCKGCGKKITYFDMQVGHKKAYSKGGATTPANSVCLCYTCNKQQGTDSFETFLKKKAGTFGKHTKTKGKRKSRPKKQRPMSEMDRLRAGVKISPPRFWI